MNTNGQSWETVRGGLMVSVLDSGSSGPGSSAGRGHCVVFFGKVHKGSASVFKLFIMDGQLKK